MLVGYNIPVIIFTLALAALVAYGIYKLVMAIKNRKKK